jgi:hypothetical protein
VLFSCAQATRILDGLTDHDSWHVVCARVLDRWNLNEAEHSIVACYYAWEPSYVVTLLRQVVERHLAEQRRATDSACVAAVEAGERAEAMMAVADDAMDDPQSLPVCALQNRLLSHMGKGGDESRSLALLVREYAARLIAKNLDAGSSDVCAVCLDECANGAQLWTCATCGNRLHRSCHRDWCRRQGGNAPCPYCRSCA